MTQTSKGSYLGKLPLWPTGPLYHYIAIAKFSLSAASFLEKLSLIPTLKTICGNRGRRKNTVRELTSSEGRASKKKRAANGDVEEKGYGKT
ncbi:hypothetical protein TNCV_905631 [Trichonephila clavipes]|nr:hypothetical protein TNCV_905631 [Trichonephila clavipes]